MFSCLVLIHSENNIQEDLFDQILIGKLEFPSPYWDNITDSAKVPRCIESVRVESMKTILIKPVWPIPTIIKILSLLRICKTQAFT